MQQHAVSTFYLLAFAISWVGILLAVGGPRGFPGTGDPGDPRFVLVMLAWLAGPSIAGLIMTGVTDGRAGYRALVSHLLRWRIGARWYALALLTAPLVYLVVSFSLSLTSPDFVLSIVANSDKAAVLVMGLTYGLLGGGFLEELGWTGFAVPRLRQLHGIVTTGLTAGFLWGAYHFSVIVWASSPSGGLGPAILFAQLFAWLPAYRVLMVWAYDRTQSLLLAMLMHASLTAGMLILQPVLVGGIPLMTWLVAWAVAWWAVVAVIALATRGYASARRISGASRVSEGVA